MAIDLAPLLSVMRGKAEAKNGRCRRNGVARRNDTPSVTPKKPGITPVTPATPQNCTFGKGVFRGVAEGVAEAFRLQLSDPKALQDEADRRNREVVAAGRTDRWCACGSLARLAWPDVTRREVWRCDDCAETSRRE